MNENKIPILLQPAVDQFRDLILRQGEHSVVSGNEVYIQPYVYLSAHLVQMRAPHYTWNQMTITIELE